MVVLTPMFKGESEKGCQCGLIGLASPIPERSSFYLYRKADRATGGRFQPDCRKCHYVKNRARVDLGQERLRLQKRYARVRAAMTPEEREAQRCQWRKQKRAQLERDPEGEAQRRRETRRRSARKRRKVMLENRQIDAVLRAEKSGKKALKSLEEVKVVNGRYAATSPSAPFRAWLWSLIRARQYEEYGVASEVPPNGVMKYVAASLQIPSRRLYAWLNETGDKIDEAVIDKACSRHGGIMPWEIAVRFADEEPPTLAEVENLAKVPTECRSPGCKEPIQEGRFCAHHKEVFARCKAEVDDDAAKMAAAGGAPRGQCSQRKSKRSAPTCCAQGCWEPREPGSHFCGGEVCHVTGWSSDYYS